MKRLITESLALFAVVAYFSAQGATLTHRYSFTSDASDSVGTADGTLNGGASLSNGVVVLDGSSGYVELPANLVSTYDSVSFEMWFTDFGSSTWARLWDIGNSSGGAGQQGGGVSYMFMTALNSSGGFRGAYQESGMGEQLIDCAPRPELGTQHQIVWTQDSDTQTATIYLDGAWVGQNTTFSYTPAGIGDTVNDWLGRSQYNDPYFYGSINEFRVYNGTLTDAEVEENYDLGPDQSIQCMGVTITDQPEPSSVVENQPATFSVDYMGLEPVSFQWFRNGQTISGATNSSFTLDSCPLSYDGSLISVALTNVVTNTTCYAISSNAPLTVIADTVSPTVKSVVNLSLTSIEIDFSETMNVENATNPANYAISQGITISNIVAKGSVITLAVSPLTFGVNYTLTLNGLTDVAHTPNCIAENTTIDFSAVTYTITDIGSPSVPTTMLGATNGIIVTATGSDIGGSSDQFGFCNSTRTGDFDVQTRIQNVSGADLWTKAGLMARSTLTATSPFAAVIATPSLEGSWFEYRRSTSTSVVVGQSQPPSYPNTWLRLKREGSLFSGYISYDGSLWIPLGSVSLSLPNDLYVGLALSSHSNGVTATAQFSDLGDTTSTNLTSLPDIEPLGPCSRSTPLVISEIMYKPAKRTDGKNLEYIEIFNSNPYFHDLSGYRLAGDIDYTFPANTKLDGWGFLVVAASPEDVKSEYGLSTVFGPYTNSLKSSSTIRLLDEVGTRLLNISYTANPPWPVAPDGTGHSLILARPSYGEADPHAWTASAAVGGSPGNFDPYYAGALRNVVINEILIEPTTGGTLELYNHGNQSVDISSCILTDSANSSKFTIPSGTIIPARGFMAFDAAQLGFNLDAEGGVIFLKNSEQTRVLDALRYDSQEPGIAFGRSPDGGEQWYRLAAPTLGSSNAAPLICEVGINEIMYNPICGSNDAQYIELYNHGTNTIDLSGWKFVDGVNYTFLSGTVIPAGGYLVVGKNKDWLLSTYSNLNSTNTVGNFSGTLSHTGERLALSKPVAIVTQNSNGDPINTNWIDTVVDEVTWKTGGQWGEWADGGGSSLEVIDPRTDKRLAANWADSDETSKAPWVTIEHTGVLDNGANYESGIIHGQLGLMGEGECLIDDVEVRKGTTGDNWVANPGFESTTTGWAFQGCFSRSSIESNTGYSGNALHLRCSDAIWSGANSAQFVLSTTTLASGNTATLRFKARWLKGWPEAMIRLNGNWLEATGRLSVPLNLGTPGMVNSCARTNAGPAIYGVIHSPSLPAASENVTVTAHANDPDGIAALDLYYRIDPATTYTVKRMNDTGTEGDAIAGDGVFSATIPGQSTKTIVAFCVVATDRLGATNRFPSLQNDNGPAHECIVLFGDANKATSFGTYHLWCSRTNLTRWIALPAISNEQIDGTLVYGNRIIYNMTTRYAGSPYHQYFDTPTNDPCHYTWAIPKDDLFLGFSSFNKIHWIGNDIQNDSATANINDSTLQREQIANLFLRGLGVPWINRRYIYVYVNGHRRGYLMEDSLRPSVSVPEQYFPNDSNGLLYKIQPWFEFGPSQSGTYTPWANESWAYLSSYTTTDNAYKTARYRWNYEIRETPDSKSNYTNLFTLLNAFNSGANLTSLLQSQVNMENWMRVLAAQHAAGNWDCFGIQNGQNLYAYCSPKVPWTLFMFDQNISIGNISWSAGANLFTTTSDGFNTIMNTPVFSRMYLRALKELATGAMAATNINPILDAKYAAFKADGINATSPTSLKSWVATAAASIISQVASRDTSTFSVTATNVVASENTVTLSGYAPVTITSISINGTNWPISWTSAKTWKLTMPAAFGTNSYPIVASDRFGNVISSNLVVTIKNTSVPESPVGNVVINEIMYAPAIDGAQYVELYNQATNTTFDLSGWEFNGLSYTFPQGATLAPGEYLILAKSPIQFAVATGGTIPIFDQFDGNLQSNGETLSLISTDANSSVQTIVDRVRYEAVPPWPECEPGTSLQLQDASKDNSRVGNWATSQLNTEVPSSQWIHFTTSGTASTSLLYLYLESAGDVYIDDVQLVEGSVSEVGSNLIANGDFESAFPGTKWTVSSILTQSTVSSKYKHSGNYSLHMISTGVGSTKSSSIYQTITPSLTSGETYTLSFWYLQSTNGGPLVGRLSSSQLDGVVDPGAPLSTLTPGSANNVIASYPEFPSLWLNEVLPSNVNGIQNEFGERAGWIELYNSGSNTLFLTNYYLSTDYTGTQLWKIPSESTIAPGGFLIAWADARNSGNGTNYLHTSFSLTSSEGSVVLWRKNSDSYQIVDYLNYTNLAAGQSFGDIPDGQPFWRTSMFYPTPGTTNSAIQPPITVYVNEWMAENNRDGGIADPVNNQYDDWFELYNAGTTAADLAGYYLSDSSDAPLKFKIPSGVVIPANGYLLVWADNNASLNTSTATNLHVNFKLSKSGDQIGLYAADGTQIDLAIFGEQSANISEGHSPDGTGSIVFLSTPTPGAANVTVHSAPVLKAIGDQYIYSGQTIEIVAKVLSAGTSVTFSLATNSPLGATIDNSTGSFMWVAPETQNVTTNLITIEASDKNVPPMTTATSFNVVVSPLPSLVDDLVFSSNTIHIKFQGLPGQNYQMEFSETIQPVNWQALGDPIVGTGTMLNLDLPVGAGSQRFYRMVITRTP